MSKFTRMCVPVADVVSSVKNGTLIACRDCRKQQNWQWEHKIDFIETILLDLVVPEFFFQQVSIDASTGKKKTYIVDGLCRIEAIVQFINNRYALEEKHHRRALSEFNWTNKRFSELSDQDKRQIWSYRLSVIEIDPKVQDDEIADMLRRITR